MSSWDIGADVVVSAAAPVSAVLVSSAELIVLPAVLRGAAGAAVGRSGQSGLSGTLDDAIGLKTDLFSSVLFDKPLVASPTTSMHTKDRQSNEFQCATKKQHSIHLHR